MNIKSTKAFDIAASMTTTLGKLVAEPLDDGGREAGGDQAPLHVGPVLGGGPLPGGPADREPGKGRGGGDAPLDLGHLGRLLRPSKSQAWASTAQRARSGRVEHRVDKFRLLVLGLVLD